jgi:hypothetical protein
VREPGDSDLAAAVQSYRPLSHPEFLASLKHLPFVQPDWLYRPVHDPAPWQGDIALGARLVLVNDDGESADLHAGPAMLLSAGCDMEPGRVRYVSMAPIFPLAEYLAVLPNEAHAQAIAKFRSNTVSTWMYLPASGAFPDSFVDFELSCPVPADIAREFFADGDPNSARIRLSENGWRLFTGKYWYHTARDENRVDFPRT